MLVASSPRIGLTIAGLDPSGGAGILADVKTFSAHGVYAEACPTLLTVQSTRGVEAIEPVRPELLGQMLEALGLDNSFDVIKIGALGTADSAAVVAHFLRGQQGVPVVLDPVLRSSSGATLLDEAGLGLLRDELLPLVTWLTPNWDELAVLAGAEAKSPDDLEKAAQMLQNRYPKIYFLITGGGRKSPDDYLLLPESGPGEWVPGRQVETTSTHGTGCTLSSALAARIALNPEELPRARVEACKRYVEGAMEHAPGIGKGAGPLNHFWQRRS